MSLRELVLEMRTDIKAVQARLAKTPSRAEVWTTLGTGGAVIFGLVKLIA